MRLIALAACAVLALAACSKPSPSASSATTSSSAASAGAPLGGGAFPDLFSGSYREEGTLTLSGHSAPFVTYRAGHKMRLELDTPNMGHTIAIVDPDAHLMVNIVSMGGQQMGFRMTDDKAIPDASAQWRSIASESHRTGECAVAGEHGQVWEHADAGGANPRSVCVTGDGVLLRATNNGETTWQATVVQRGPQSEDLFRAPQGVRLMELGPGAASALAARLHPPKAAQN